MATDRLILATENTVATDSTYHCNCYHGNWQPPSRQTTTFTMATITMATVVVVSGQLTAVCRTVTKPIDSILHGNCQLQQQSPWQPITLTMATNAIATDNTHRGSECLLGTDPLYFVRPLLEAAAHFVWQELAETVTHVDLGHLRAAVAIP